MKIAAGLIALMLIAPVLIGQDDQESQEDPTLKWTVNRLKQNLDLTDDQAGQVKNILQEASKSRDEKIREILTEEQKENFKGVNQSLRGRRRQSGGNRGGGGFGGGNWLRGLAGPSMDQLKKDLNLTDEQSGKIEPIMDEFSKELEERMAELRENGFQGLDWREEMQKFQERTTKVRDDIKEHLDDEQKKKLDEIFDSRNPLSRFGRRNRGQGGTPTPRRGRGGSVEQRVDRILRELNIEDEDEKAAIRSLIEKLVKATDAQRESSREERNKIREVLDNKENGDDEVGKFLEELRTKREELQKPVREIRRELREVVSYRQELILIRLGILK